MRAKPKSVTFSVSLTEDILQRVYAYRERCDETRGYVSRSQALRELLHAGLGIIELRYAKSALQLLEDENSKLRAVLKDKEDL